MRAVNIADNYIDFKIPASDASSQLLDLYMRINNLPDSVIHPDKYPKLQDKEQSISDDISNIEADIRLTGSTTDLLKDRNSLASLLNISEK